MKSALLNPQPGTVVFYLGDFMKADYKPTKTLVYITHSHFMGEDNRISNTFRWRPIKKDGTLGKEVHGYGNFERPSKKYEVKITITEI